MIALKNGSKVQSHEEPNIFTQAALDRLEKINSSQTKEEAAKKLGVSPQALASYLYTFRKHGVPVKRFPRTRTGIQWDILKSLSK